MTYYRDTNSLAESLTSVNPDHRPRDHTLLQDKLGIVLRRYDQEWSYLDSKYFAVPITRPTHSTIRIANDDIWPHVPIGIEVFRIGEKYKHIRLCLQIIAQEYLHRSLVEIAAKRTMSTTVKL